MVASGSCDTLTPPPPTPLPEGTDGVRPYWHRYFADNQGLVRSCVPCVAQVTFSIDSFICAADETSNANASSQVFVVDASSSVDELVKAVTALKKAALDPVSPGWQPRGLCMLLLCAGPGRTPAGAHCVLPGCALAT